MAKKRGFKAGTPTAKLAGQLAKYARACGDIARNSTPLHGLDVEQRQRLSSARRAKREARSEIAVLCGIY